MWGVGIWLICGKHLHGCIISLRGGGFGPTKLAPFIEVPFPSQERECLCIIWVSILHFSPILIIDFGIDFIFTYRYNWNIVNLTFNNNHPINKEGSHVRSVLGHFVYLYTSHTTRYHGERLCCTTKFYESEIT